MAGYYPSMPYDPTNPTQWKGKGPSIQPGYGPMSTGMQRPGFNPNLVQNMHQNYTPRFTHPPSSRTNVYVSGFPTEWSSNDLKNLFQTYGPISEIKLITKPSTEQNRGVAFVHFLKPESATRAVDDLKTVVPEGCTEKLTVRNANASKNVQPEFLKTMRVNASRNVPNGWALESALNLYISQLPDNITEQTIRDLFEKFGKIKNMKVTNNQGKGSIAFVHFDQLEDAIQAVAQMDETKIGDSETPISVRFANVNSKSIPEWFNIECLRNMQTTTNVYVTHVPIEWDESKLRQAFESQGDVSQVKLISKNEPSGNIAFVHFEKPASATKAVAFLNDKPAEPNSKFILQVIFARMDTILFEKITKSNFIPHGYPGGGMGARDMLPPQIFPQNGGYSSYNPLA